MDQVVGVSHEGAAAGQDMSEELWAAIGSVMAGLVALRLLRERRRGRARQLTFERGAIVFVRTPDRKRLLARVVACGPSHLWVELSPGDAHWWVPASAVEPAPVRLVERASNDGVSPVTERTGVLLRYRAGRGREWA